MKRCAICGTNLANDLFAAVAQKPTCAVCTVNYIGGLDSPQRIASVRAALGLQEGQYLQQDNAREAARILGRS
jgi:hypothetical protein